MPVFCAGTFLRKRIARTRVIANIFHTRSWNASTCIWAIHNVCTRAVSNSILRDVLQLETKNKFALTSLVIEMTIHWCGTVPTHAGRSAKIPRTIVTVVTLGWNSEFSVPSVVNRYGPVASNHLQNPGLHCHDASECSTILRNSSCRTASLTSRTSAHTTKRHCSAPDLTGTYDPMCEHRTTKRPFVLPCGSSSTGYPLSRRLSTVLLYSFAVDQRCYVNTEVYTPSCKHCNSKPLVPSRVASRVVK